MEQINRYTRLNLSWISLCLLIISLFTPNLMIAKESFIVGRIEYGVLLPENIKLKVKMDTGATMSSLHAEDIEYFTKDDKSWVRFMVQLDDNKRHEFTRKIAREVDIKKRRAELNEKSMTKKDSRPVVLMDLCLNGKIEEIEVNLADRSDFIYPMLLGTASMKKFGILIEPTQSFITEPNCQISSNDKPVLLVNHR